MASTTAQVNSSGSSQKPASNVPVHCNFPGSWLVFPDCLAFQTGLAIGGGSGATNDPIAQTLAQAIIGLVNLPFKALGLNGFKDAAWRSFLILLALIVLAFGLLIFASSAASEAASNPKVQQTAKIAAAAA